MLDEDLLLVCNWGVLFLINSSLVSLILVIRSHLVFDKRFEKRGL